MKISEAEMTQSKRLMTETIQDVNDIGPKCPSFLFSTKYWRNSIQRL